MVIFHARYSYTYDTDTTAKVNGELDIENFTGRVVKYKRLVNSLYTVFMHDDHGQV